MNVMLLGVILGLLFYVLIPCIGRGFIFRRWYHFRNSIINSSHLPIYSTVKQADISGNSQYRFFGELEAIEEGDIVWLNNGFRRIRVCLESCHVYILPGGSLFGRENVPKYTQWQNLGSLSEGIKFFVVGHLNVDTHIPSFENHSKKKKLMVVIHDVEQRLFLSRSIEHGRERSAYWNNVTAASLLLGILSELLLLIIASAGTISTSQFIYLVLCVVLPGIILAPPGILLYFAFRRCWDKGRQFHVESDLFRLLLRYPKRLPDGSHYSSQQVEHIPKNEETQVRRISSYFGQSRENSRGFLLFSAENSADPFAERIYVNDHPQALARTSRNLALRFQILSLVLLGFGLLINVYIVVVVLRLFLSLSL